MTVTEGTRFSEVKGLTDRPRLPRLGKIRLGTRDSARGFPRASDFFVVPEVVQSVYGPKPRELDVVFPSDDVSLVAPVAWKQYTATRGKVCTGDGERAVRIVDDDKLVRGTTPTQDQLDAAIATKDSAHVSHREITCPAKECVFAIRNLCKPVMNLQFMLPSVPGIGVWQLDTGSYNSIVDVRGGIELVMKLSGDRLAGIPLKLRLEPMEVISPDDQKKKIVHTLKLISPAKLGKVLMDGERNLRELLMADYGTGVGLPELPSGDVPPPHEPEEDLYRREQIVDVPPSTSFISGAPTGNVQAPPIEMSAPSASAEGRPGVASATSLFDALGVTAKDRRSYERLYSGKPDELIAFLEKQIERRRTKP